MADDEREDEHEDEHEHDDEGDASQAFADLRAEVMVMRRAVEGLPALIRQVEAPDYGPSLGAVVKAITATETRLAKIEGHPALQATPEAHGRAMARVVAESTEAATRALRNETDAIGFERRTLADIVGHARAQDEQRRVQYWIAGAGLAAGLVLFPLLGAFAPGGGFLAMLATGSLDRWQAGVSLMQAGDPVASRSLAMASRLMNANSGALRACAGAAQKAGKEQKCTIIVVPPGQ